MTAAVRDIQLLWTHNCVYLICYVAICPRKFQLLTAKFQLLTAAAWQVLLGFLYSETFSCMEVSRVEISLVAVDSSSFYMWEER
jgi:hypothetical protein